VIGLLLYNAGVLLSTALFPAVKLAVSKRGTVTLLPRLSSDFEGAEGKILLHVSSVGEAVSVKPLVERLRGRVALTAFTDYGLERLKSLYPDVPSRLAPLDFYPLVEKFLTRAKPQKVLLYETEIWPCLLACAKKLGIPVYFVSGKLSGRSYRAYSLLKGFLKPYTSWATFLARSPLDAERARNLGFKRVEVVGDLKMDTARPESPAELRLEGSRKVVLWGSTHPGEEDLAFRLHGKLKGRFPNLLTVVAPRHPGRCAKLKPPGSFALRSKTKVVPKSVEFYIVDTVGELPSLYALADVCIIGGSFVRGVGGHNPVEAVVWKKPVVAGEHCEDYKGVMEALKIPTVKEEELQPLLERLMIDEAFYDKFCEDTFSSYLKSRGVAERILSRVSEGEP
jgi:3-deoxy-D-manno-octulosonic-acid transferase